MMKKLMIVLALALMAMPLSAAIPQKEQAKVCAQVGMLAKKVLELRYQNASDRAIPLVENISNIQVRNLMRDVFLDVHQVQELQEDRLGHMDFYQQSVEAYCVGRLREEEIDAYLRGL